MSQSHSLSGLWTSKCDPKETLSYFSAVIYFRHKNFSIYIPPWIIEQQLEACVNHLASDAGVYVCVNISCSDCSWGGRLWGSVLWDGEEPTAATAAG